MASAMRTVFPEACVTTAFDQPVRRGGAERGDAVRNALGVGEVVVETSTADVADVIIVIGKDYRPPAAEKGAP